MTRSQIQRLREEFVMTDLKYGNPLLERLLEGYIEKQEEVLSRLTPSSTNYPEISSALVEAREMRSRLLSGSGKHGTESI